MRKFPISIGVIVFSYTSQIFLPTLEGSMQNKEKFPKMLCWSYIASCLTKEFFALFCFLMWAENTKDVVTDNLPGILRVCMNTMLVVKALLSYPLPYYQSIEIFEQNVFTNATGGWGSLLKTRTYPYTTFSNDTEFIDNASVTEALSPANDEEKSSNSNTGGKITKMVRKNYVGICYLFQKLFLRFKYFKCIFSKKLSTFLCFH